MEELKLGDQWTGIVRGRLRPLDGVSRLFHNGPEQCSVLLGRRSVLMLQCLGSPTIALYKEIGGTQAE